MKIKHFYLIASIVLMSSCSLLNNGINRGQKAKSPEYYTENGDRVSVSESQDNSSVTEPKAEVTEVKSDNAKNTGAVKKKEAVNTVSDTNTEDVAHKNVANNDTVNYAMQINGEWIVMEVFGEKVNGDERPYFTFEAATKFYYGSNGCNTLNGNYDVDATGKLTLSDGASTLMMCHDAPYEYKINNALGQTVGFKLSKSGNETVLKLLSHKGHTVMVLKRANMDYLNGAWKVTRINGEPDLVNDEMKFVFDVTELRLHGNSGCNIVNGQMFLDPDKANSVQFQNLISTRMMCPDVAGETSLLIALEETYYSLKVDDNTIVFKNKYGEELIRLERLDLNK